MDILYAQNQARVTLLSVTHNSGMVITNLLDSLPSDLPIVIVDNGSDDDTRDIINTKMPSAKLICNKVGVGYGNAMNIGLKSITTQYALLINPDSLITRETLQKLVESADRFSNAALLGPSLQNDKNLFEYSHDVGLFKRHRLPREDKQKIFPVGPLCAEFISGAIVLVRVEYLRSISFFDKNIFLYYEDDDLCMRLREKGFSLMLIPNAIAKHTGGGSVRPSKMYYWEKFWHIAWSRLYIECKYKGKKSAQILASRNICKFFAKSVGYLIVLNFIKSWRDCARLFGSIAFLIGRKALEPNHSSNH